MDDEAGVPFWRRKSLKDMTQEEWESLCDGCGRCCLIKLEEEVDDDPGAPGPILFTNVACKLLDGDSCRCRDYPRRQQKVPDCLRLTPDAVAGLHWLPPTCAYKLVEAGEDLKWWHPLVSGSPDTVHQAGVSVRGRVSASEDEVPEEDLIDYIVSWPGRWPKGARAVKPAVRLKRK